MDDDDDDNDDNATMAMTTMYDANRKRCRKRGCGVAAAGAVASRLVQAQVRYRDLGGAVCSGEGRVACGLGSQRKGRQTGVVQGEMREGERGRERGRERERERER
jgi:hypothetical protein